MPCREHLAQLRQHTGEIDRLGARVVVISFEPPDRLAAFADQEHLPFTVLSDPDRVGYRYFGLVRGRARVIWNLAAARAYLVGALRGRLPRFPRGDLAQLGGDVVLGADGRVLYLHRSAEPSDRPNVAALLAALRAAADGSHR